MPDWNDARLARDRADAEKNTAELEPVARRYEELREGPPSYRVDVELEVLRPRLDALYQRREVLAHRVAAGEERQRIGRSLMQQDAQVLAALIADTERIKRQVDVPDLEVVTDLYLRTRERDVLRLTLHELTGLPQYARKYDAIDQLRYHWHEQQQARERLLNILLAPGARPRPSQPAPWAEQVARLREVRGTGSAQRENAHATR